MKLGKIFFRAAACALMSLLCLQAQSAGALLQQGVGELRAGNFQHAEELLRRSYEIDNSARSLEGLAEALIGQHKNKEAVDLVSAEVAKDPKRTALWMCLGNTAALAGSYDVAIQQFQALLKLTTDPPQVADLYHRIGESYRRKGDLPQAVAAFRQAREKLPQSAELAATLAVTLDTSGDKKEAVEAYRAALALNPKNGIVINNLAYTIAITDGDLDEALRLAQQAQELLPQLDEVADTMAAIYVRKHETDRAIEILQPVIQKNPGRAEFRKTLASALDQIGGNQPEVEELKTILRAEPTTENSKRLLELLPAIVK